MNSFTVGQGVIVSDRRDLYAYMEGVVFRAGPDRLGRVGVDFPKPDQDGMHDGRHMLDAATLSPLPKVGERRRWNARNSERRQLMGPFVITGRHDDTEERLFSIWYEARQVHGSASAAELAGFSELVTEHDGADGDTTGETRTVVTPPSRSLDTLRDVVLETALAWEALRPDYTDPVGRATEYRRLYGAHLDAIRDYRAARDA